jgi:probable phosphoglycerate mutase
MIPLLVIRHGPTDWNAAGLIQGRTNRPLSAAGRHRMATMRLPSAWSQARSVSSPLLRAMETARLLGLDAEPEPRLIEMAWGEWEGRTLADLRAELGLAMSDNERRGLDFRPAGGESPREVQERLRPWLASLAAPTLAVTHKGVLRALYAMATGWDLVGKPGHKLLEGHAHCFGIGKGGGLAVTELNIPLGRAG